MKLLAGSVPFFNASLLHNYRKRKQFVSTASALINRISKNDIYIKYSYNQIFQIKIVYKY